MTRLAAMHARLSARTWTACAAAWSDIGAAMLVGSPDLARVLHSRAHPMRRSVALAILPHDARELAGDRSRQRQAIAYAAHAAGRRLTFSPGPDMRIVSVCSCCGEDDVCDDAEPVDVVVLRPMVALGVTRAPVLGTAADLERLGLGREAA